MTNAYVTAPNDATITGWARVGDIWLSVEPLRDASTGGYAHLCYRGALEALERLGATMATAGDIDALRDAGINLAPVLLPDAAICHEAGVRLDDEAGKQRLRVLNMMGLTWAQNHDAQVQAQLDALAWDGSRPVANAGKHWIAGAPTGRAWLKGWWLASSRHYIQAGTERPGDRGFHDDEYADYPTTTVARRSAAPEDQQA